MAKTVPYDVINVFLDDANPYSGNPLAVFHGGGDLSQKQCQILARQLNLSETTFPANVSASDASYDVRIFTPMREIPFAGHPTLGTCFSLLQKDLDAKPGKATQKSLSGETQLQFGSQLDGAYTPARIYMKASPHWVTDRLNPDRSLLDAALGLKDTPIPRVQSIRRSSCGLPWTFVQLKSVEDLDSLTVTYDHLRKFGGELETHLPSHLGKDPLPASLATFVIESSSQGNLKIKARVFFNANGVIVEDPATGSAALALGLVLHAEGLLTSGAEYAISQGDKVGAPSQLFGSVETGADGKVTFVKVGGDVVKVGSGDFVVPSP